MVYELPANEKFIDFVEYHHFDDIGFKTAGLRIEACSCFTFLTLEKKFNRLLLNVMFVDPYYEEPQISLFQATSFFEIKASDHIEDIFVKCIMY